MLAIDLVRGMAVIGMLAAHVAPAPAVEGGLGGLLLELCRGRSHAVFATLAGLTLTIVLGARTDPRHPGTGPADRHAKLRVAIRATLLMMLAGPLTLLGSPVTVILAYYGMYFLLALPLMRLRTSTLVVVAAVIACVGPLLYYAARWARVSNWWWETLGRFDVFSRISGETLADLLLAGPYPAVTWMAYLTAGLALGRLDPTTLRVRRCLALLGPGLVLLGYGGSWLAFRIHPAALLASSRHSNTTFEVVGNIGVTTTMLICAVAGLDRIPQLRRLLAPVIATGAMPLTVYVGHVVALMAGAARLFPSQLLAFAGFVVATVVFAMTWTRFLQRGPLEYLLHRATSAPWFR